MPYITEKDRRKLLSGGEPQHAGHLNYLLTKLIHKYLGDSPNYQKYNDAIGAIEGAKLELYRRKVSEYEDLKIKENGDV